MKDKESSFYLLAYHSERRANPPTSDDVSTEKARALATKLKAKVLPIDLDLKIELTIFSNFQGYFEVSTDNQAEFKKVLEVIMKEATKIK